jgi:transposase
MDAGRTKTEVHGEQQSIELLLETVEKQRQVIDELRQTIKQLQQTIKRLKGENERLRQRLGQYEPEVLEEKETPSDDTSQYSVEAEEKRRRKRKKRKKKSPGRRRTAAKFAAAEKFEQVVPAGFSPDECRVARKRAVWRLIDGRAVLVGYTIYRAPGGEEPPIPGVPPRCEYGLEIHVVLAFLVYIIGISLDKACAVMGFFAQLPIRKSQAESLLRQLARHWEDEFEMLCDLILYATVVYTDETGWKVGDHSCSLWTFATQLHRLFLFGCRKDAATLETILPPDVFQGIGVSDDAAVYRDRFRQGQKCWAHLLRKAIRLTLLYPRRKRYRKFLDRLLTIFYDAKRASADKRLGEAGRAKRVAALARRLRRLCNPLRRDTTPQMDSGERDFCNLVQELLRLAMAKELFTFVLVPEVEATNNLPERLQRSPAADREAGRTSKTAAGARRRSIIFSVLESLRANLESFTLASVLNEVQRWMVDGISLFAEQLQELIGSRPPPVQPNMS